MEEKRFGLFDLVGRLRKSLLHASQVMRAGPVSSSEKLRELTERLRETVDLDAVELAPTQQPPAPTWPRAISPAPPAGTEQPAWSVSDSSGEMAEATLVLATPETVIAKKRGHPPVHDWDNTILPFVADYRREIFEEHKREPTLKECHNALIKALVPSYDTFRKKLATLEAETPQSAEETPKVD